MTRMYQTFYYEYGRITLLDDKETTRIDADKIAEAHNAGKYLSVFTEEDGIPYGWSADVFYYNPKGMVGFGNGKARPD